MKVKLKTNLSGPENVHGYPGDVVEIEDARGQQLIDQGFAEPVDLSATPRPQ